MDILYSIFLLYVLFQSNRRWAYRFHHGRSFVTWALLLFEKMFASPNRKNMLLASAGSIMLFLGDIQITIFALFYLLFRIGYHFVINRAKNNSTNILKRVIELLVLVSLFAAPFMFNFTILQNTRALSVTSTSIPSDWLITPSQFFLRGSGYYSLSNSLVSSFYSGIILFVIALAPMFISRTQSKLNRSNYLFHWITFAFFVLVAIGTPLEILVTTFFVRVPNRGLTLIVLSLCMCAGYGLLCLSDFFAQKTIRFNLMKSKPVKTLLIIVLATAIFADLTIGTSPITSPVPNLTGGDHFIQNQQGDFRVLKYPIVWGYTNYESALINHEIIGVSAIALRDYPENSELFCQVTNEFNGISESSNFNKTTGIWNIDAGKLTLLATLCGTKYVLIEKNQTQSSQYINFFGNSTKYFALVLNDQDSVVYENLCFKGTVFAVKDDGQLPVLANLTIDDLSRISLPDTQINYTESFNRIRFQGAPLNLLM